MYLNALSEYRDITKVILYMPIDAGPINPKWVREVRTADRLIYYTQYGKDVVEEAIARLQTEQWEEIEDKHTTAKILRKRKIPIKFPKISVIPHGIDLETFRPIPREEARKAIFPDHVDFGEDAFVVLNANRNQPRKRIDITIKGFEIFAEGKPQNVKLYLHMGIEDMGWNIIEFCKMLDLDDRLVLSSTQNTIPGIPDDRLNLIYNACDVGLNTSVGEGWGLISFEHAATRAAQILPDHSAGSEIWRIDGEPQAELLPVRFWLTNEKVLTEGGLVTPENVAQALQRLYENKEYRDEMADKAYKLVHRPEYQWKKVARQFDKIFKEVLAE